jgi:hypothetical protein
MSDPTCCLQQNGECASCAPVTKPKKKFVGKRKTKTEATVSGTSLVICIRIVDLGNT